MSRKEVTAFLSDVLIKTRLSGIGKIPKYQSGELKKHVMETSPPGSGQFGVMVAVPNDHAPEVEFEAPTLLNDPDVSWTLEIVVPCRESNRKRSMTELLFCMLRAGH